MKNSTSIQITNYLIVKSQFYTHGYTVFDNFLPEDVFDGIVGLWEKSNFEEENQILDHYKEYQISGSSYDTYFPTEDEDYLCSYWGSSEITKNTEVGRMGATYIQPILEDIAGRRLLIGNHQANIYKNNGKNHSRVHMDKWGWEAAIGYILFVIKSDWKYDWGRSEEVV